MHFLKQKAKLTGPIYHISASGRHFFLSLSLEESRRKSPDCRLNSVYPPTAAPNCSSCAWCIYLESKGWRCSSVCLETKAQSGDEKGICLQVGRNWSSRHLCMMRAGVSCWPGGVQQQAAGTGTITSFSASGECGCGKVKISPTRIIKITMIKKSKDKHIQECHYSACSTLSMGCVQGHRNKLFLLIGKLKVSLRSEAQFKGIIPRLWACRICTSIKQCKCEESG